MGCMKTECCVRWLVNFCSFVSKNIWLYLIKIVKLHMYLSRHWRHMFITSEALGTDTWTTCWRLLCSSGRLLCGSGTAGNWSCNLSFVSLTPYHCISTPSYVHCWCSCTCVDDGGFSFPTQVHLELEVQHAIHRQPGQCFQCLLLFIAVVSSKTV